ncbi:putative flavoprotein involved in K+ transport [Tepidamorphus gemmatus]|uniref:Putative flavoprotein involved in K+ transport n=1 Tax=Tepidamorphus gemmatus TaxID=747076 RepID=A0A4R3LWT4_9HYPH|nr:NAD(P)/FAD-dependent oxidoreductase [Tepidamorphus gemmatus]TCT03135.1 putative flavoprotein involved in K+ transport [Tepidamorphus gemmatus]
MPTETIDTLIVGGGQAGIALSEHLGRRKIPHLILEKNRIAEAWRSGRWDSLVANGPAWHDRFPNMEFRDFHPDDFVPKDAVADYLENYARMVGAPIRTGVEVRSAEPWLGRGGFHVETSEGAFHARRLVAATGAFQIPVIPPVLPEEAGVAQIHSYHYRNPEQLAPGAVLVVGGGSSGAQIADELNRAGRAVYLSIGPHERPPRRYRERDFVWWLGVLGLWDMAAPRPGTEHVTIAVSGAYGGQTMDFRRLAAEGVTLLGMTDRFEGGRLLFRDDLRDNIARGDESYLKLLDQADAYVERTGIALPEEPEARRPWPDPESLVHPIRALDLAGRGVRTVIWATGFRQDYSWIRADAFDERGAPLHSRGVSVVPDLYFLGLPWQSRRGSSFIWGVWHDAKYIADQIAIQNAYLAYPGSAGAGAGGQTRSVAE